LSLNANRLRADFSFIVRGSHPLANALAMVSDRNADPPFQTMASILPLTVQPVSKSSEWKMRLPFEYRMVWGLFESAEHEE
jgi:hypothetical protein